MSQYSQFKLMRCHTEIKEFLKLQVHTWNFCCCLRLEKSLEHSFGCFSHCCDRISDRRNVQGERLSCSLQCQGEKSTVTFMMVGGASVIGSGAGSVRRLAHISVDQEELKPEAERTCNPRGQPLLSYLC